MIEPHMYVNLCRFITVMRLELILYTSLVKAVAEMGRHKVSVTSAERGKTHTVLTCVSAAGNMLPPMMIFPHKQTPPNRFQEGAVAQTLFL